MPKPALRPAPGTQVRLYLTADEHDFLTSSTRCFCGHLIALHNYDREGDFHMCSIPTCGCMVTSDGKRLL